MKLNIFKSFFIAAAVAIAATGCSPDEVTSGNPLTEGDLDAGFTVANNSQITLDTGGIADQVVFHATSTDPAIQYHTWRYSDATGAYADGAGNTTVKGSNEFTHVFTANGTYKIEHRVVGYIGGTNFVSETTVTITDIPAQQFGVNLIQSPNFENASDWTVFNTNSAGTVTASWTFNGDSATVSGGVADLYAGQGIYQAVQVEAGTYYIDMHVSSPGASDKMWFQVFTGNAEPQQNADYLGDDYVKLGLNTWSNCALAAFDGQLSEVGCVGTGTDVTFAAPQTVYFVIKCGTGAANGVNNITVDNVVMKKYL